nr:hypothetical protein [Tanacetum cinerariifolium]
MFLHPLLLLLLSWLLANEEKRVSMTMKAFFLGYKLGLVLLLLPVVVPKGAGGEGHRKKKRVCIQPEVVVVSDQVSSPNPLNQAQPLEALSDEGHVSPLYFVGGEDRLTFGRRKMLPEGVVVGILVGGNESSYTVTKEKFYEPDFVGGEDRLTFGRRKMLPEGVVVGILVGGNESSYTVTKEK